MTIADDRQERIRQRDAAEGDLERFALAVKALEAKLELMKGGPVTEDPESHGLRILIEEGFVQTKRSELEAKRAKVARLQALVAQDALAAELEVAARHSESDRVAQIAWLRSRVAWASSAMLAGVLTIAAGGVFHQPGPAAEAGIHVLWWAGAAVALAAVQSILLATAYTGIQVAAGRVAAMPRLGRLAPKATVALRIARWVPSVSLVAELVSMGMGAWNLSILLESVMRGA